MTLLISVSASWFQSTRPVRGATGFLYRCAGLSVVSIHAPRAGRDPDRRVYSAPKIVSIHAPRAGRDPILNRSLCLIIVSIHAPRAGRDRGVSSTAFDCKVSIHAPRAGRDSEEYGAYC